MMSDMNGGRPLLPAPGGEDAPIQPSSERPLSTHSRWEMEVSPLHEYLAILLRRRWTVLVCFALILGVTVYHTVTAPRIYEASATLLVTGGGRAGGLGGESQMPGLMAAMAAPTLATHAELIRGRAAAEATAAWLTEHGGPELPAAAVQGAVRASPIGTTDLLRVTARAPSPEVAEGLANAAAQAYRDLNRSWARGSSESAGRFLADQLTVASRNLADAEKALRQYKEDTGTITADAAASRLLGEAAAFGADVARTEVDLAQTQERLSQVRGQLAEQNRIIATAEVRDNAAVLQLRAKLVDLEGQRLAAQSRYTEAFPGPLNQLDEQIRLVKEQLDAEIRKIVRTGGDLAMQQSLASQYIQGEVEIATLRARIRQLRAGLQSAERQLKEIPEQQITFARLQRQVDVAQSIHADLLKQSQEIEVGRILSLGNTDVVELAATPRLPVKPNVPLNIAFGVLFGLAVGVGLALLREQLDDSVRGEEDVARFIGVPVLGTVPMFRRPAIGGALKASAPGNRALDAYRALRYNVGFVTPGGGGRTVLVTSAVELEGKTTTALNLAIAAARSGRRVVLVESDLRRPSFHRLLSLNGTKGLSDWLIGDAEISDIVEDLRGPGLRAIRAGGRPPNPTDLLDSARMRSLVQELRGQADLVVFDSPPLLSTADALVLAGLSDAVLMVCVPGTSRRREMQRAGLLLAQVGRSISGVVLNKVERRLGYGYYDYYYQYHYAVHEQDDGDAGDGEGTRPGGPRERE